MIGETEMAQDDAAEAAGPTYELTLEGEGIKVARTLSSATAMEVLSLVMTGGTAPGSGGGQRATPRRSPRRRRAATTTSTKDGAPKPKARRRGSPGVVKDLSLRPKGKIAFADFVAEKGPKTHQQKQTVIVYWLHHEAGLTSITPDHVNTCYVDAGWARPADLYNNLQVTAGQKGWLDTRDMSDIKVTTRGEDEVNHNLPPQSKRTK